MLDAMIPSIIQSAGYGTVSHIRIYCLRVGCDQAMSALLVTCSEHGL